MECEKFSNKAGPLGPALVRRFFVVRYSREKVLLNRSLRIHRLTCQDRRDLIALATVSVWLALDLRGIILALNLGV